MGLHIVTTSTEDGHLYSAAGGTPTVVKTSNLMKVGRSSGASPPNDEWRSFMFFDTSGVTGHVVSVRLWFYVHTLYVSGGDPLVYYPYICNNACAGSTLDSSDWDSVISGDVKPSQSPGYFNPSGTGWFSLGLPTADQVRFNGGCINQSGYTNVCLTANELGDFSTDFMIIRTADYTLAAGYEPYLEIRTGAPQRTLVGVGF